MGTTISSIDTSSWTSLQTALAAADTNSDGVVSKSELVTAAESDSSLASEIVTAADSDGDGSMSLLEFQNFAESFSATTGLTLLSAQEESAAVTSAFTDADTDGSATLTADELATLLTASTDTTDTTDTAAETEDTTDSTTDDSDSTTVSSDVETVIAAVDTNGDGTFDKTDMSLRVLQAASEAAAKDKDTDLTDAMTSSLDTNGDGTVSQSEMEAAGLA